MAPSKPASVGEGTATVEAFLAGLAPPPRAKSWCSGGSSWASIPPLPGIKWKVLSFRTTDYFATLHLRMKAGLGLFLHLGAKVRDLPALSVEDPEGLPQWLAKSA